MLISSSYFSVWGMLAVNSRLPTAKLFYQSDRGSGRSPNTPNSSAMRDSTLVPNLIIPSVLPLLKLTINSAIKREADCNISV